MNAQHNAEAEVEYLQRKLDNLQIIYNGYMEEKKACIYFQLSADPAFKAFASANVLEIESKPVAEAEKKKKKNEKPKYQVTANAYDDYCEGKLTADGLTPTSAGRG